MSLIFPKKPLYAPMLGTLGGGSVRGFGRGGVGGQFLMNTYFRDNRSSSSVRTAYRSVLVNNATSTSQGDHAFSNQYNPSNTDTYYMPIWTTDDGDNNQWVSSNGPQTDFSTNNKHWWGFTGNTNVQKFWDADFIDIDAFRYWATGSSVGEIQFQYRTIDEDQVNPSHDTLLANILQALSNNGVSAPSGQYYV